MKESNSRIRELENGLRKVNFKVQNIKDLYKLSEFLLAERKVRFIAPVCPDYPLDSQAELGQGIPAYTVGLIHFMENFLEILRENGISCKIDIILADTETDIKEIVWKLAGTKERFLSRCQTSANLIKSVTEEKGMSEINTEVFSSFFDQRWHERQYKWEDEIKQQIQKDERLKNWLEELANKRTKKYEAQFKRSLSFNEKLNMAIRHYAQYSALAEWIREKEAQNNELYILINSHSPNLRAMGKPLGNERIRKIIVIIPLNSECDF